MTKYLLAYFGGGGVEAAESMSKEDVDAVMMKWQKWFEDHKDNALDFGNPFRPPMTTVKADGSSDDSDDGGPTGYSIMQANSLDELKEMLKSHPHLQAGDDAKIVVHACVDMG